MSFTTVQSDSIPAGLESSSLKAWKMSRSVGFLAQQHKSLYLVVVWARRNHPPKIKWIGKKPKKTWYFCIFLLKWQHLYYYLSEIGFLPPLLPIPLEPICSFIPFVSLRIYSSTTPCLGYTKTSVAQPHTSRLFVKSYVLLGSSHEIPVAWEIKGHCCLGGSLNLL